MPAHDRSWCFVGLPSQFDAVALENLICDCWAKVEWGYGSSDAATSADPIIKNDSTGAGHSAHRIRRATSAAPRQWIKTTIAPAGNPREKARRRAPSPARRKPVAATPTPQLRRRDQRRPNHKK